MGERIYVGDQSLHFLWFRGVIEQKYQTGGGKELHLEELQILWLPLDPRRVFSMAWGSEWGISQGDGVRGYGTV